MTKVTIESLRKALIMGIESGQSLELALQPYYDKSPNLFFIPLKEMSISDRMRMSNYILDLLEEDI